MQTATNLLILVYSYLLRSLYNYYYRKHFNKLIASRFRNYTKSMLQGFFWGVFNRFS